MPVDVRATWNDHWNNNLPLGDYVWSNLPFTNPNVVVTESGQPVLMSDYAATDGNWDADKPEMIRQRTEESRGRLALRGNDMARQLLGSSHPARGAQLSSRFALLRPDHPGSAVRDDQRGLGHPVREGLRTGVVSLTAGSFANQALRVRCRRRR